MAILEKEVLVNLTSKNINHFEEKGYAIPRKKDNNYRLSVPKGSKIFVKIEDLPKGSHVKVTKECDVCGKKIPNQKYSQIILRRNTGNGNDRCFNCGKVVSVKTRKQNIKYENSLDYYAKNNNLEHLISEFSKSNKKTPYEISHGTKDSYLWNCSKCSTEYSMSVHQRTAGNRSNCPYCAGYRVNNSNCLATTHPDIARLLKNKDDSFILTKGSHKKVWFICSNCGSESKKSVQKVVFNGLSCTRCSDGLSYPEKIMRSILDQLEIKYEWEVYFPWSKKIKNKDGISLGDKRYDFYVPDLNMIIETHGKQHYEESNRGRSLYEEQESDRLKESLAKKNTINNYIVINCKVSDLEYIKNSIINSELSRLLNLSGIDWLKCHEYACRSMVKETCELWTNGMFSIEEIAKKLNIHKGTAVRYLKYGSILKWCNYDPQKEIKKNGILWGHKRKKEVVQISLDGEFLKQWDSATDVFRVLNIHNKHISATCRGRAKSAGGFKWMYKEDYDQYIKQAK